MGQHRDVRLLHQLAPVELVGGQVRFRLEVDLKPRQKVVHARVGLGVQKLASAKEDAVVVVVDG